MRKREPTYILKPTIQIMKKATNILLAIVVLATTLQAKPVTVNNAQNFAEVFYKHHAQVGLIASTLAFAEISSEGDTLYYVFNMNEKTVS